MTTVNDFLAWAIGGSANVQSQANFVANPRLSNGFLTGVAPSDACNKLWRQSSFFTAVIATFIQNVLNESVLDDGDLSGKVAAFTQAVQSAIFSSANFNATSGHVAFAGGLVIQWGSVSATHNATVTFNFDIAFPNAAMVLVGSLGTATSGATPVCGFDAISTTQGQVHNPDPSTDFGTFYIAIGH